VLSACICRLVQMEDRYAGVMPRAWSRLHEYLGRPPGPITFDMVRRCIDGKLAEADDLDWKAHLPDARNLHMNAEFAKDVAAMANTRGGVIIYGVTDQVEFSGIDSAVANPQQYAQWVRNLVQPYLSGLELYPLLSDDGSKAVLVVDVPASELAPHCVAFVDVRDKQKAEEQRASVTPYRDGPHTAWMAEHQIARAYAERMTRAAEWQQAFDELRDWTAESFEGRGGPGTAWLIITGRPVRPVPRAAPRLDREAAKLMVDSACNNPVATYEPVVQVLRLLAGGRSDVTVGLDSWVIANRAREGTQSAREARVELHHDGSFVLAVNLSQRTLRDWSQRPPAAAVVNVDVVEQACVDLEAMVLQVLRAGRIDSPMRVQISVASEGNQPLRCATRDFGDYNLPERIPPLPRLLPITVEITAGATEEHTKPAAVELAAGVLNQFGLVCQLQRYRR
jgi:schlafen family protein